MKNYKKIYERLIKEINKLKYDEENYKSEETMERLKLLDKIESRYAVSTLNLLLRINEEIAGRKHSNQIMNEKEFKQWKMQIERLQTIPDNYTDGNGNSQKYKILGNNWVKNENNSLKYCGEIIDRSWFDDSEAYHEGTYTPIPVSFSGDLGTELWNDEFYQAIERNNRVYLDEYPEQKVIRKKWFRCIKVYRRKLVIKILESGIFSLKCKHLIPDLSKVFDKSIEESVNKSILSGLGITEDNLDNYNKQTAKEVELENIHNVYEHFNRRFMRKE